jgi:ribosomal protein L12E/L44/L45/RPP1/RPP2
MRSLPVYALALVGVLMASCAKQEASAPAAAPAAPAAAAPAAQSGGQTTNFEDNTQTQAPVPAAPTS